MHLEQASLHSAQEDVHAELPGRGLWAPAFLRRSVLAVLCACFLSFAITLPVLYAISERNQGLCTVRSGNYYLWTYGPTAVLTLTAAFWSQVEFRSKQLTPWKIMHQGLAPASQTLLLDYISPWNVLAMFGALKQGHHMAALPIIATLFLSLMTVFSTGLLSNQNVNKDIQLPVSVTQTFNGTGFNTTPGYFTVGQSAFAVTWGIQNLNLSYPFGTTQHYAFPDFNITSDAEGLSGSISTLTAELDIFVWDVECEEANTTALIWKEGTNLTLAAGSCNINYDPTGRLVRGSSTLIVDRAPCDGENDTRLIGVLATRDPAGQPAVENNNTANYRFTSTICTPKYNISRAIVTYGGSATDRRLVTKVDIPPNAQASSMPDITSSDILMAVLQSAAMAGIDPGYAMVNATFSSDLGWLDDYAVLSEALRKSTITTGPQVAKENFLRASKDTIIGTASVLQNRLLVRVLSFALMEALSGILSLLALGMILFYPSCAVCSRDPGSIGGLATVLARSQRALQSLRGLGAVTAKQLENRMSGYSYRSITSGIDGTSTFYITQIGSPLYDMRGTGSNDYGPSQPIIVDLQEIIWWQPFATTMTGRVLLIAVSAALVVTLEILYRISHSSEGIVDVSSKDQYIKYTWVYLPALAVFGVETLYASMAFAIKMFQPYHAMRGRGSRAPQSLLDNALGKVAVLNLRDAIVKRQAPVAASSLAMILAPLLMVVVSGLYTSKATDHRTAVVVQQLDAWQMVDHTGMISFPQGAADDYLEERLVTGM